MPVRAFAAFSVAAVLAVSLSACDSGGSSGSSGSSSAQPLTLKAFKDRVAAAVITGTDLQADPGFGALVDVSSRDSLDTLQLVLTDPYREYRADPGRQQEIVDGLVHGT